MLDIFSTFDSVLNLVWLNPNSLNVSFKRKKSITKTNKTHTIMRLKCKSEAVGFLFFYFFQLKINNNNYLIKSCVPIDTDI